MENAEVVGWGRCQGGERLGCRLNLRRRPGESQDDS